MGKRMIETKIIDTDYFDSMPLSTKYLYLILALNTDDDGFVAMPQRIMRVTAGVSDDDLKLLVLKKYIIRFKSGVVVVTDHNVHNTIRPSRRKDTLFKDEMSLLNLVEKRYELIPGAFVNIESGIVEYKENLSLIEACSVTNQADLEDDRQMSDKCQPSGRQMSAKNRTNGRQMSARCQSTDRQIADKCQHNRTEHNRTEHNITEFNIKQQQKKYEIIGKYCFDLSTMQEIANNNSLEIIVAADEVCSSKSESGKVDNLPGYFKGVIKNLSQKQSEFRYKQCPLCGDTDHKGYIFENEGTVMYCPKCHTGKTGAKNGYVMIDENGEEVC